MKEDTSHYDIIYGENRIIGTAYRYVCRFCFSEMDLSECGLVCICHHCETKIPRDLLNEFWNGFWVMVDAMEKFFIKRPEIKLEYDKSELTFPGAIHKIGTDQIKKDFQEYQEREKQYAIKREPLKIWYPS